jgi:hypothetical protein
LLAQSLKSGCDEARLDGHGASRYDEGVSSPNPAEAPFDPRWLDAVASACGRLEIGTPRLVDLFLERRLEVRVRAVDGTQQVEECRAEGAAARWRFPSRTVLHARTGVSSTALGELLTRAGAGLSLPPTRMVPPAELDPPRGFREWAFDVVGRLAPARPTVTYMARRAAVVRSRTWANVTSPPLVRVHLGEPSSCALLAVWRNPELGLWLQQLAAPPGRRSWSPPPGQALPVVFAAGTAGALLHEVLGHLVESDLALTGASPLARLGGSTVAPATLNLGDDPTRFELPGAFSSDDEGFPAQPRTLLQAGVLVGWLCDRAGAERLASPPGRGRRASFCRPPVARLSNLVLEPGQTSPSDLEHDVRHGLVVTRVGGASVDPLSGRTVIRVERGFEVVRGRRARPLQPFALTGSVLELLAHIDPNLGSDSCPEWRLGWCVKGGAALPTGSLAPTLLVHRLEVL